MVPLVIRIPNFDDSLYAECIKNVEEGTKKDVARDQEEYSQNIQKAIRTEEKETLI